MKARSVWFEPMPIGIYGTAALNGLGFDPHQTWALRRAEQQAFYATPFRDRNGEHALMSFVRTLPPRAIGGARLEAIGARLVGRLAALSRPLGPARVLLGIGLPERMGEHAPKKRFAHERRRLAETLAGGLAEGGHAVEVVTEARGHASLAHVLFDASQRLAAGTVDLAVVGGLDTYYDPDAVEELLEQQRLFDGVNLDAFVPAEGGAFLLLARRDVAKHAGLSQLGRLEAAAAATEPAPLLSTRNSVASGSTAAAGALTDVLRRRGRRLDLWLADVTHEDYRIQEWQLAHPRVAAGVMGPTSRWEFLPVYLGDLGAATMPTAVALAIEAFLRGDPPGDVCLVTSSSAGADRGAVLVSRAPSAGSGYPSSLPSPITPTPRSGLPDP